MAAVALNLPETVLKALEELAAEAQKHGMGY